MTISYIAGTTAGSLFAYVLDKIIHYEYDWTGDDEHIFGGLGIYDFNVDAEPTTVMAPSTLNNGTISNNFSNSTNPITNRVS